MSKGKTGSSEGWIAWTGIKKYYFEPEAVLFAAKLRNLGIQTEVSNLQVAHPLPLSEACYVLHVPKEVEAKAKALLMELEQEVKENNGMEDSYREISKEEILYLKKANSKGYGWIKLSANILLILLLFLILRAVILGQNFILF